MHFSIIHGRRLLRGLAGANVEMHCTWEMSLQAWHVNTTSYVIVAASHHYSIHDGMNWPAQRLASGQSTCLLLRAGQRNVARPFEQHPWRSAFAKCRGRIAQYSITRNGQGEVAK